MEPGTLQWIGDAFQGHALVLDQRRLPEAEVRLEMHTLEAMVEAIRTLAIRGAPALGLAGAYGLVLALQSAAQLSGKEFLARARSLGRILAEARPTAVNLPAAIERALQRLEHGGERPGRELLALLFEFARALEASEREAGERIGAHGAELIADGMGVLTHCNAGALCTVGLGTALAPIYAAARQGKRLRVFADETRPLFQGARLTAWELQRAGLSVTVIVDGAAGHVFQRGLVQAVFVGADRIAANGDFANKIGTYSVAVLARRHAVPFYVVAPLSTLDLACPSGAVIPIEERAAEEVTHPLGTRAAPAGVTAFNPAFDVTPAELVSAFVCERGVVHRPDERALRDLKA
jgi:methylthioribose-1-phosphate isomerase